MDKVLLSLLVFSVQEVTATIEQMLHIVSRSNLIRGPRLMLLMLRIIISLCVKGLCMVMEAATEADSSMLEQYVDFLQGVLFAQISQPVDYRNPASVKNHNELLRCFAVIGQHCAVL